MFIGAEEILRTAVDICEIATAAAGDENFLADAIGTFEDRDAASTLAGLCRTKESRGAGAEDESIEFVSQRIQALVEPHGCKLSLRSLLRLN